MNHLRTEKVEFCTGDLFEKPLTVKKLKSYDGRFERRLTCKKKGYMKDNLHENNLIRFINLSRRKDGLFANFKVKGIKGGTTFTASISVDLAAAQVDLGDALEKIIEECARIAVKEIKKAEFQFEGLQAV